MLPVDSHRRGARVGVFLRLQVGAGPPAHVILAHQGQQDLPAAPRGKGHPHVVKDRLGRRRGIGRFRRPVSQRPLRHVFILRSGHFSHCPFSRFLL